MSPGHNDQTPIMRALRVHKPPEGRSRYDKDRASIMMDVRRSSCGAFIAVMAIVMPFTLRGAQQTLLSTDLSRPSFDVASIKQNKSLAGGGTMGSRPGGRFLARNVPLRALVDFAYDLRGYQLAGGPDWMTT